MKVSACWCAFHWRTKQHFFFPFEKCIRLWCIKVNITTTCVFLLLLLPADTLILNRNKIRREKPFWFISFLYKYYHLSLWGGEDMHISGRNRQIPTNRCFNCVEVFLSSLVPSSFKRFASLHLICIDAITIECLFCHGRTIVTGKKNRRNISAANQTTVWISSAERTVQEMTCI